MPFHITASVLAALLSVLKGGSASRDLLEMSLRWQKPAPLSCELTQQRYL